MSRSLCLTSLFGFTQLLLSMFVWGNLEYSLAMGDMAQPNGLSPWTFVFSFRLLPYALISIGNMVLFWVLEAKSGLFRPGVIMTVALAAFTVLVTIPIVLYTPLRAFGPFVGVVAFVSTTGAWCGAKLLKKLTSS